METADGPAHPASDPSCQDIPSPWEFLLHSCFAVIFNNRAVCPLQLFIIAFSPDVRKVQCRSPAFCNIISGEKANAPPPVKGGLLCSPSYEVILLFLSELQSGIYCVCKSICMISCRCSSSCHYSSSGNACSTVSGQCSNYSAVCTLIFVFQRIFYRVCAAG